MVFAFANTLVEFGVVLMIGGNIDDQTRVASIVIYNAMETIDYKIAHIYSAALLLFGLRYYPCYWQEASEKISKKGKF